MLGSSPTTSALAEGASLRVVCINDVYTLDNLPCLKTVVQHHQESRPADRFLVTLAGDFLAPSILSSLDKAAIGLYGVVYAPGSAGTIQEIFQDAAQNHYTTYGFASPMVFLGKSYWTEIKPVYPLLKQLAAGHDYERWLLISDDVDVIAAHLRAFAAEHAAGR